MAEQVRKISLLVRSTKARAKRRGIPFSIEPSDLGALPVVCPVLGVTLLYTKYGANRRSENSASIDRISPALGYVPGNVRIISWKANRLKSNGTAEELAAVARDAAELAKRRSLRAV